MNLKTWVEIETTKGTQTTYTYRGQVDTEKLDLYISGTLSEGILRLEKVYWVNDFVQSENDSFYVVYGLSQNKYYDFAGDLYLRIEHISCISTMNGMEGLHIFSDISEH